MYDLTILTITNDPAFLDLLRGRLDQQAAAGSSMIVAHTIDEACSLLRAVHPRLVVVHWARDSGTYEELDRLLWATTVQSKQIPVVVIAERYRTDQATMMYRMGVSDYISRTHHLDNLGSVFSAYMPAAAARASAMADQSNNAWSSNHKAGGITTQAI